MNGTQSETGESKAFNQLVDKVVQVAQAANATRSSLQSRATNPPEFVDGPDFQGYEQTAKQLRAVVTDRDAKTYLEEEVTEGTTRQKYHIRAVDVQLDHNPQFGDGTPNQAGILITGVVVRGFIAKGGGNHQLKYSSSYSSSSVKP